MAEYRLLPVSEEDYEALGIGPDTVVESFVNDRRELVIRAVSEEDLLDYVCGGDCEGCPLNERDCDGHCFACPCSAEGEQAVGVCCRGEFL